METIWLIIISFIFGFIIGNCRNKIEGHKNHTDPDYSHGRRRTINTKKKCEAWNYNHPHKRLDCCGNKPYKPIRTRGRRRIP